MRGRRLVTLVVGACAVEVAIAIAGRAAGASRLIGIHGVLSVSVAIAVGLVGGLGAGLITGAVGAIAFDVLVAHAEPPAPLLFGLPIVVLWAALAGGAGALAAALRADRARARAGEVAARERAERLSTTVTQLAAAREAGDVARIAVEEGADALLADAAWLAVVDEARQALLPLSTFGLSAEQHEHLGPVALDARAVAAEVARDGRPRWFPDGPEIAGASFASVAQLPGDGRQAVAVLPLESQEAPFGVLALFFGARRAFSVDDRELAEVFAGTTAQALQRALLYTQARMTAERLQRSLLPAFIPSIPAFEVALRYRPASDLLTVGGDWYDLLDIGNGRLGVAVGDVGGKGIEAAAIMGRLRTAMRAYALEHDAPADVLRLLAAYYEDTRLQRFATMVYAVLDSEQGELRVTSAGHLPPVVAADGASRWLSMPVQPPLGSPVTLEFTETRVPLADDTLVIMFTDGVVERRDAPIDTGVDEVRDIAAVARWRSVDALADDLLEAVVGTNARDDRALVVVRHARSGGGFVSRGPGFEDVATDAQHAEREPSVIRP